MHLTLNLISVGYCSILTVYSGGELLDEAIRISTSQRDESRHLEPGNSIDAIDIVKTVSTLATDKLLHLHKSDIGLVAM